MDLLNHDDIPTRGYTRPVYGSLYTHVTYTHEGEPYLTSVAKRKGVEMIKATEREMKISLLHQSEHRSSMLALNRSHQRRIHRVPPRILSGLNVSCVIASNSSFVRGRFKRPSREAPFVRTRQSFPLLR